MEKIIIYLIIFFSCVACNPPEKEVLSNYQYQEGATKLNSIARPLLISFLNQNPPDTLYGKIIQRYSDQCYPIKFLNRINNSKIQYKLVPYFSFYEDELKGDSPSLHLDTISIRGFLLFNDRPFAEFDINNFSTGIDLSFIQGVTPQEWDRINNKIDKGYKVFRCNIKVKNNHVSGTAFLPYIFYINDENEIIAHNWLKNYEISIDEVIKKLH